jgi:hypothetical protein
LRRDALSGSPEYISTGYIERSHLTLRMTNKRFARLSNGFGKRLENHPLRSRFMWHTTICAVCVRLCGPPQPSRSALLIGFGRQRSA